MSEFDMGLPSIRQVQEIIKEKQSVEIKLGTGDSLLGRIVWQDANFLCLINPEDQHLLIWRQALVYIKPKG
jgi:host factor-I protein